MNQRYTFKCWRCSKTYTLLRDITGQQTLVVACPYCNADAIVDMAPLGKKIKQVIKGAGQEQDLGEELVLPDVLPTAKPE
jgi:DNA-directed RNA polymerase subunit RPC12/RpoP